MPVRLGKARADCVIPDDNIGPLNLTGLPFLKASYCFLIWLSIFLPEIKKNRKKTK